MLENLSQKIGKVLRTITGKDKLSADNIKATLAEVEIALLEADVALAAVEQFKKQITAKALGQQISSKLTPSQYFIKLVQEELTILLGSNNEQLQLNTTPPAIILLVGLQGSGKTTTAAKLANFLKEKQQKKVMLASTDIYRPAAIKQLEILASQVDVAFCPATQDEAPLAIAKRALDLAQRSVCDVLIVDTAGRLEIDQVLMQEVQDLQNYLKPIETLFVVDSTQGQNAYLTAKAFAATITLSGIIATKLDSDARGGALLSARYITNTPIKFIGVSEKIAGLEPFYPERLAERILGMGDVLTLIEQIEAKVDKEKAAKLAAKIAKGRQFDFEDMREQLQQMLNMGGMANMLDKLPGMNQLQGMVASNKLSDKPLLQTIAIINSMTIKERRRPDLLNVASRVRRIANGAGVKVQEVKRVFKQYEQMQKMFGKVAKGGLNSMLRGLPGLAGKLPPKLFS